MKKLICMILVVLLSVSLLTACDGVSTVSELRAQRQMAKRVERMLTELSVENTEAAKAMLLADIAEDRMPRLIKLQEYLAGRKIVDLEQSLWTLTTTSDGAYYQENADYKVQLKDGAAFFLSVRYIETEQNQGLDLVLFMPDKL